MSDDYAGKTIDDDGSDNSEMILPRFALARTAAPIVLALWLAPQAGAVDDAAPAALSDAALQESASVDGVGDGQPVGGDSAATEGAAGTTGQAATTTDASGDAGKYDPADADAAPPDAGTGYNDPADGDAAPPDAGTGYNDPADGDAAPPDAGAGYNDPADADAAPPDASAGSDAQADTEAVPAVGPLQLPPFEATQDGVRRLAQSQHHGAAVEMAQELLTRNEVRFGADDPSNIELLDLLATAQAGHGDMRGAADSLARMILLLENRDGIFAASLIEPLKNLGIALQAQDKLDEALDAFVRARHVTHRRYGVINGEQIPIVDLLTELHIARGKFSDANREQRLAFRIATSNCGDDAVCTVEGMYKLARWYQRSRRFTLSRGFYKDALEILEEAYGDNHPSLVDALHGVAQTYAQQGYRQSDGRRSLERAAAILDSQPYVDMAEHVQSHLKLGDWYNLNNDHDEARSAYERAWVVMTENGIDEATSAEAFGQPVKLRYRPPIPDAGDPAWHPTKLANAFVTVEFDVNEMGRVENARVVDSNIGARVRKEVRDSVRSAKYRPRMIAGEPVRTDSVRLKQRFDYVVQYQAERARQEAARRAGRRECMGGGCVGPRVPPDPSVSGGGIRDARPDDAARLLLPNDGNADHEPGGDELDVGSLPDLDRAGIGEELP